MRPAARRMRVLECMVSPWRETGLRCRWLEDHQFLGDGPWRSAAHLASLMRCAIVAPARTSALCAAAVSSAARKVEERPVR